MFTNKNLPGNFIDFSMPGPIGKCESYVGALIELFLANPVGVKSRDLNPQAILTHHKAREGIMFGGVKHD
tara:strand:- start:838 stop:1047 length:210 start_codon:yes stop_codon:yes gene_type:complete